MTFVTVKRDVEVRIPVQEKLNNSWKYAMAVIILDVLQVDHCSDAHLPERH